MTGSKRNGEFGGIAAVAAGHPRRGSVGKVVLFLLPIALAGAGYVVYTGWNEGRPETLWRRAQADLAAGDYEAADKRLESLLQQAPEHREARLALAEAQVAQAKKENERVSYANYPPALENLRSAWELKKDDLDTAEKLLAAYLRSNRLNDGAPVAAEILRQKPEHADALYLSARAALEKRDVARGEGFLARLTRLPGEPRPRTLVLAAMIAHENQKKEEYVAALEQTLSIAADEKEFDDVDLLAIQLLLSASVEHATTPAEANRRAKAALEMLARPVPYGREADAAMLALSIGANIARRLPAAAGSDLEESRTLLERAYTMAGPALKAEPPRPAAFAQAAQILYGLGRNQEADERIQEGLAAAEKANRTPALGTLELHLVAAQQLAAQGRFRSAQTHVEKLLKQRESAGWGHLLAGNIALLEGRYEDSLRHLTDAQRQLGPTLPVKFSLARALMAMKRWERALAFLDALHVDPRTLSPSERHWAEMNLADGLAIHMLQAQARLSLDDSRGAERHLAALEGTRFEPEAIRLQVTYLWNKRRFADAAEMVQSARSRFPENLALARLHALLLARRNQPAAAERVLAGMAERNPDSLAVQIALCQWIISQRRYDEALERIAALKEKFPKKAELQLLEANTLLRADRAEEALQVVQRIEAQSLEEAREVIGVLAAMRLNELDEAAEGLEVLAGSERRNPVTSLLAANLASARGDTEQTIAALEQSMQYSNVRSRVGAFLYRAVLQLAQKEGPAAAEARLNTLLEQYPGERSLMMARVDLQWQQGQRRAAFRTLDSIVAAHPGDAWPAFVKAKMLALDNQRDAAMKLLDELLVRHPAHLEARLLFANLLIQDQPADAVLLLDLGLKIHPDQPQLLLMKAAALAQANKLDEALAVAEGLAQSKPELPQVHELLARLHVAAKQPEAAVEDVKRGVQQMPANADFLRVGMTLLCQLQKFDEAEQAARLAASSGDVALAATEVLMLAERIPQARAWAEMALARAEVERRPLARLLLADIARLEGRAAKDEETRKRLLAEAGEQYALVADGDSPWKLEGAIRLMQLQAFDADEAQEAVKRAEKLREGLDLSTAPLRLIDTLIAVLQRAGQIESHRALIDAVAMQRPDQLQYLMAKAQFAPEQTDFREAVEDFQKLAQENPELPGPSYALAWLWAQRSNPRVALQSLEEALRRDPRFVPALELAIEQHRKLGNHSEVIRYSEALLAQNPQQWEAQIARLEALRQVVLEEEYESAAEEAIEKVQKLAEQQPEDVAVHLALAKLHRLNGELDECEATLRKSLESAPHNVALVGELIDLLITRERREEAEQLAEKLAGDPEAGDVAILLGRLFYKHGLYAAARRAAERKLDHPVLAEQVAAHWLLGDVALAEGKAAGSHDRFLEARDHYRWMLDVQPTHIVAGNNLAWVLVSYLDEPQEALAVAEQVRAGSPVHALHPSFVDTLARSCRKAGKLAEAQTLLEESLFVNPEQVNLRLELVRVLMDAGNPAAARTQLQTVLGLPLDEAEAEEASRLLAELD